MPNGTSWNTVEEATSVYRLETSLIQKWVEAGAVRALQPNTRAMKVNVEDLEQMVRYQKKFDLAFQDCD